MESSTNTAMDGTPSPSLKELVKKCLCDDNSVFTEHMRCQTEARAAYVAMLKMMLKNGADLTQGSKVRVLAAALVRKDVELVDFCLRDPAGGGLLVSYGDGVAKADNFGLMELVKAAKLLDSGRQLRAKTARLAKLTADGRAGKKTLGKLQCEVTSLQREALPAGASLSGAMCKWLRRIVALIPVEKLQFFALQMPKEPWKELSDLLHLCPATGTRLPWFLPFVFGQAPPPDSVVAMAKNLAEETAAELVPQLQLPYSFVRTKVSKLSPSARAAVAAGSSLDQLIWWYDELQCAETNQAILAKLDAGEQPSLPYGQLLQRLMYFQTSPGTSIFFDRLIASAERQLTHINLSLDSPVAVLGDASGSMEVAIRVAVIIGSILKVLTDAQLVFFNGSAFDPAFQPKSVKEVIKLARETKACNSTSPAAALGRFYASKTRISTFIVVTDEEENTQWEGCNFAALYAKYCQEVFPAKLVFISFLPTNAVGQMVRELQARSDLPSDKLVVFTFNKSNPDLTKLDTVFSKLSLTYKFAELDSQLDALFDLHEAMAPAATATAAKVATATATPASAGSYAAVASGKQAATGAPGLEQSVTTSMIEDAISDAMEASRIGGPASAASAASAALTATAAAAAPEPSATATAGGNPPPGQCTVS